MEGEQDQKEEDQRERDDKQTVGFAGPPQVERACLTQSGNNTTDPGFTWRYNTAGQYR